jgi:hypothetical protein
MPNRKVFTSAMISQIASLVEQGLGAKELDWSDTQRQKTVSDYYRVPYGR